MPSVLAYILSNWILDANSELNGYGFPFDRSHLVFYNRLKTASKILLSLPQRKKNDKYIIRLNTLIWRAITDRNLEKTVSKMKQKAQIFDQLRDAMRIAVSGGKKGIIDDGVMLT